MLVIVGGTLFTMTVSVYSVTPSSLSLILAPTASAPSSLVEQVALLEGPKALYPPAQRKAYVKPAVVSALLGSEGLVSARLMLLPSATEESKLLVAVGATLAALQVKVSSTNSPSGSVARTTTVLLLLLSLGVCDQLHVPSPLSRSTVPAPDTWVRVSGSLSSSAKAPLFVSWDPSLPETLPASVLTVGAWFVTGAASTTTVILVAITSSSLPPVVFESTVLVVPAASLRTILSV